MERERIQRKINTSLLTSSGSLTALESPESQASGARSFRQPLFAGPVGHVPIHAPSSVNVQRDAEEEQPVQMMRDAGGPVVQRESMPEEEEAVQMMRDPSFVQRDAMSEDEEQMPVQPLSDSSTAPSSETSVSSRIQSKLGGGQELDAGARDFLEPRFGHSFENVRIHADGEANALSKDLGARAFTTGQDIFFRSGEYQPGSSGGQQLLAHELTHTIQQARGPVDGVSRGDGVKVSDPNDGFEREAENNAHTVINTSPISDSFVSSSEGMIQQKSVLESTDMKETNSSVAKPLLPKSSQNGLFRQSELVTQSQASKSEGNTDSVEVSEASYEGAKKIAKGVKKLLSVAEKVEKKAESGHWYKANSKDLMALASQIKDLAEGFKNIKEGFETFRGKLNRESSKVAASKEPELPSTFEAIKSIMESITQAFDTTEALNQFEKKPSRETANKWATEVTKQFSAAKSLVSLVKLPPGLTFISEFYVGLLGAPAAYVSAFQEISRIRYEKLEKEMGRADSNEMLTESGTVVWTGGGPVMTLVQNAFSAPEGHKLYLWLKDHKKINDINLEKSLPSLEMAKALYFSELRKSKEAGEITPENEKQWRTWIANFQA
jgi:hypothetical protein